MIVNSLQGNCNPLHGNARSFHKSARDRFYGGVSGRVVHGSGRHGTAALTRRRTHDHNESLKPVSDRSETVPQSCTPLASFAVEVFRGNSRLGDEEGELRSGTLKSWLEHTTCQGHHPLGLQHGAAFRRRPKHMLRSEYWHPMMLGRYF